MCGTPLKSIPPPPHTHTQVERVMAEVSREKEELETRLEEDQDEMEDLLGKQRTHITQMSALQGQLGEARAEIEELQEAKVALENKVCVCVCVCERE